jgi:hypothetical protein
MYYATICSPQKDTEKLLVEENELGQNRRFSSDLKKKAHQKKPISSTLTLGVMVVFHTAGLDWVLTEYVHG